VESNSKVDDVLKATSKDKTFFDSLVEHLALAYLVQRTSPIMYDEKKDVYFQFFAISRRA
jgi:hypothetical protein